MIVGTAGHVDHGKTTLVRALTGVDTDRLAEEKARGISIELGYAFLDVPDSGAGVRDRIGFIDVPGHERLVHTMLAGTTGIDFGLLLVAADDGVMPQTREHLAVLSLLGLARGALAITKVDRVDAARVGQVRAEVAALLAHTPLADVKVLELSAQRGDGLEDLRALLFDAARQMPPRATSDDVFRLAIDRAFTLDGVGTVVTGTVCAGQVQVGDELELCPSAPTQRARVRSLHAQNHAVAHARAGERCAVALAGLPKVAVSRGQWLVAAGAGVATERLDALLTLWHDEGKPLRSGTPVHVHLGASDTLGTVAVLKRLDHKLNVGTVAAIDSVPPGGRAQVQIVLRAPIGAWRGDRIVLRDNSAKRTIAGGIVLDPFAPARYRRTPQRLSELAAWSLPSPDERLSALIAAAPLGISLKRWASTEGLLHGADPARDDWLLGASQRATLHTGVLTALAAFHSREPDMLGPDAARLRRLVGPRLPESLWRSLLADLQHEGVVGLRGACVHLPEQGMRLSVTDERISQKTAPLFAAAGLEGSWVRDLARDAREGEAQMRTTLARLAQRAELHQVTKDLFYPPASMARLAAHARSVSANSSGEVTAARFRDATGLGRKRAIQILEYFDRIGLLRRAGDAHWLRLDTALFTETSE